MDSLRARVCLYRLEWFGAYRFVHGVTFSRYRNGTDLMERHNTQTHTHMARRQEERTTEVNQIQQTEHGQVASVRAREIAKYV